MVLDMFPSSKEAFTGSMLLCGDVGPFNKNENCFPSWELTYTLTYTQLKMFFLFQRWDMLVPWRVNLRPYQIAALRLALFCVQGLLCAMPARLGSFLGVCRGFNEKEQTNSPPVHWTYTPPKTSISPWKMLVGRLHLLAIFGSFSHRLIR